MQHSFALVNYIVLRCVLVAAVTASQATGEISIPDPNLESSIRTKLGLGPADLITETALSEIMELTAHQKSIVDLTGLEYCHSMTYLKLWNNHISDLTPLQGLSGLRALELSVNDISDLTPLQGLTGLRALELNVNQVSDLTPLQELTELRTLLLAGNGITDLAPLLGLTNLNKLWLSANPISDFTLLQSLTGLKELYLESSEIRDLTPLQGLFGLTYLRLFRNQISNLEPLYELTNLTRLDLYENQISDLTPLHQLKSLKVLFLQDNQISDLSPLQELTDLMYLQLNGNCISDLSALLGFSSGSELYVDLNPLSDAAITIQIPQLIANDVAVFFSSYSDENCPGLEGEYECVENPEGCSRPHGGSHATGDDLCLSVPCPVSSSSTFEWKKDGIQLTDGERIYGASRRTLQIVMLTVNDSGRYSCTYDDGTKTTQVFEAHVIVVENLPALGAAALIMLFVFGASLSLFVPRRWM